MSPNTLLVLISLFISDISTISSLARQHFRMGIFFLSFLYNAIVMAGYFKLSSSEIWMTAEST